MTELVEDLLPVCYGRLNLKTSEIEELTIREINAMVDGWQQRYYDMQDLFIVFGAIPVYQTQCKNPPKYEDFVKDRPNYKKHNDFDGFTLEELRAFAEEE